MIDVILLFPLKGRGETGDVVTVKGGFARNYLLPRKLALRANDDNRKVWDTHAAEFRARSETARARAEDQARILDGTTITFIRQASNSGQLYGSIAPRDIVEAAYMRGVRIKAANIELTRPIKTLGLHRCTIILFANVTATIQIAVATSRETSELLSAEAMDPEIKQAKATRLLSELAANLSIGTTVDATDPLLEIVHVVDEERGEQARRAVQRDEGSHFAATVRSVLHDLSVDCLIGVNAAPEDRDERLIRFDARVFGALPAHVGAMRDIRVLEGAALDECDLQLSLFTNNTVIYHDLVRERRMADDGQPGSIRVSQVIEKRIQRKSIDVWASAHLNGDCIHRRIWSF